MRSNAGMTKQTEGCPQLSLWFALAWLPVILSAYTAYEDGTGCSETSAYNNQRPGNHPKERIQHKGVL
jgi:hypothetical protein